MEIRIHLERSEPPTGRIVLPSSADEDPTDGRPVEFVGWLGMLRAMYEVLGYTPPAG